jgi:hypothetical protein
VVHPVTEGVRDKVEVGQKLTVALSHWDREGLYVGERDLVTLVV